MYASVDANGLGPLSILTAQNKARGGRDSLEVALWSGLTDEPNSSVADGFPLSFFRARDGGDPRLLCWNPLIEYRPISRRSGLVPSDLFVLNYSREWGLPQHECFSDALRAAARLESLLVESTLEVRALGGDVISKTTVDPTYNPMIANVCQLAGRQVAIIGFNSGYQVSEALYRELVLPLLSAGRFESPRAVAHLFGSFRGVLALDLETGTTLWERRLGAIPVNQMLWADFNGDGLEEIVVSTYSPSNGVSANGVTDCGCAYLLCLDADGHEIWRRRFSGWYIEVSVAAGDVDGDGASEIVAVVASWKEENAGELVVLAGDGHVISRSSALSGLAGLVLADITGDGVDEILTSNNRGHLIGFDGNLRVVAEYATNMHDGFDHERLLPMLALDVDGDGETEAIALSTAWSLSEWNATIADGELAEDPNSYLVSLDQKLREEARAEVPGQGGWGRGPSRVACSAVDLNGDGVMEIAVVLHNVGIHVFEVVPMEVAR